jgi:hypothetical protein
MKHSLKNEYRKEGSGAILQRIIPEQAPEKISLDIRCDENNAVRLT